MKNNLYNKFKKQDVRDCIDLTDLLNKDEKICFHTMGEKLIGYVNSKFTDVQTKYILQCLTNDISIEAHGVFTSGMHFKSFLTSKKIIQKKIKNNDYRLDRRKKSNKIFNVERPYFIEVQDESNKTYALLITFPSQEYLSQYSELLLAFIKLNLQLIITNKHTKHKSKFDLNIQQAQDIYNRVIEKRKLQQYYYPDVMKTFTSWSGLKEINTNKYLRKGDIVLLGYVSDISNELIDRYQYKAVAESYDFNFFGINGLYGIKTLISPQGNKRLVLIGFKHSYWGRTSSLIVKEVIECGARRIIYCAKAGTRTGLHKGTKRQKMRNETDYMSYITSGYSIWEGNAKNKVGILKKISMSKSDNFLKTLFDHENGEDKNLSTNHISVPTVVGEDSFQYQAYEQQNPTTIDNEISYIAEEIHEFEEKHKEESIEFDCIHFITDLLVTPLTLDMADQPGLDQDDFKRKLRFIKESSKVIAKYVDLCGVEQDTREEVKLPLFPERFKYIIQNKTQSSENTVLGLDLFSDVPLNIINTFNVVGEKEYIDLLDNFSNFQSIVINGESGVGKSVLAQSTYKYLLIKNRINEIVHTPIYVDIKSFEKLLIHESFENGELIFNKILSNLTEMVSKVGKSIIIFDGLDEISPFVVPIKKLLNNSILQKYKDSYFMFFCRTYRNFDFEIRKKNKVVGIDVACQYVYSLGHDGQINEDKTIDIDSLTKIVSELSCLSHQEVVNYHKKIDNWHEFSINLRLFHLIVNQLNEMEGGQLTPKHFFDTFLNKYLTSNEYDINLGKLKRRCEKSAYEFLVSKQKVFPLNNSTDVLVKRISTQSTEMLCYLAASYIDKLIFDTNKESLNLKKVDRVYPYLINKYAKELLEPRNKKKCLDVIEHHLFNPDSSVRFKAFLTYLIGRINGRSFKNRSLSLLSRAKNELHTIKKEDKNLILTYERSIYISLIYLGKSSEEYIKLLIKYPEKDLINRGFHLAYYGDKNYFEEINMLSADDCKTDYPNTRKQLLEKIKIEKNKKNKINLYVYTLYSLAFARRANSEIDTTDIDKVLVSNDVINSKLLFPAVKEYLDSCLKFLNSNYTPDVFLLREVLKLKKKKRDGWVNNELGRNVKAPESIFDHIGHAAYLALCYLPENPSIIKAINKNILRQNEYGDYDKDKIIRYLLVHDIGEYEFGDIPSPKKSPQDVENERKAMGVIELIPRSEHGNYLVHYSKRIIKYWQEYASKSNINAKIAKDIDVIECLIQLQDYHLDENNFFNDYDGFLNDLIPMISTVLGKELRDILMV